VRNKVRALTRTIWYPPTGYGSRGLRSPGRDGATAVARVGTRPGERACGASASTAWPKYLGGSVGAPLVGAQPEGTHKGCPYKREETYAKLY